MRLFWRKSETRQASEWFARIRSGRLDPRTDRAWSAWMAGSTSRQKAYENHELMWELASEVRDNLRIQVLLQDADNLIRNTEGTRQAIPHGWWLSWQAGVAAMAVIAIGIGSAYFALNRATVSEYTTEVGSQRVVPLADGTVVTLNTGTQLRVRYSRRKRRVDLLRGEALFAVTHENSRPFEVWAMQGQMTDLGTTFDVRQDASSVSVSVLEGEVAVSPGGSAQDRASVSAGQAIDYTREGKVSATRPADTIRIRAWQANEIVFSDMPLEEALNEYNRYIRVPIVLGDPSLAARHINGVFRIGDEGAFLGALQRGLKVKIDSAGDKTVLTSP